MCELCNYQTYVFFHLQQLNYMDTMPIPDEGKQVSVFVPFAPLKQVPLYQ